MVKKLLAGAILCIYAATAYPGYSSGGRSGFSGGSRGYSSSSVGRSYSTGRSGYTSSYRARTYSTPSTRPTIRSYSGSSSHTTINNHHYSHSGGMFGGNGFFSGFLGGYLGGSMANHHAPVVVAGGGVVPGEAVVPGSTTVVTGTANEEARIFGAIISIFMLILLGMLLIWVVVKIKRSLFDKNNSRW